MAAPARVCAVAGAGTEGFADGEAFEARFNCPWDVAVAPDNSLFVADRMNHAVRRVAPDGTVTTVAGTGEPGGTDGPGEVATFNHPARIAVDQWGTVFVSEFVGRCVRKIARATAGGWAVSTVVAATAGVRPSGIAVDPVGRLVVADRGPRRHRVVRVDPATGALEVIAGDGTHGFRDGPGATARFYSPEGVAVDRHGDIFVAESEGHRVRRISARDCMVTTVAGSGIRGRFDGAGSIAQFAGLYAIAVDGRGVLLVADNAGLVSKAPLLRQISATADRAVTRVAWAATDSTALSSAAGFAIDRDGGLLITDSRAHRIFRMAGLGLVPLPAPPWSLRAHRGLAAVGPEIGTFVTTVMLCAMRLDTDDGGATADAVPRLPVDVWLAILSMLRPEQMVARRFSS